MFLFNTVILYLYTIKLIMIIQSIKTHSRVSAAKKDVRHTSVFQDTRSCVSGQERCAAYKCVIYRNR